MNAIVLADVVAPTVSGVLTDVATAFSTAVGMLAEQPIALVFIGISVAGAGLGLFKRIISN